MNMHWLRTLLKQFRVDFLVHFSALTEQDVGAILSGPSETLLRVLQQRYGYTHTQAKAAWYDFAIRYVNGYGSLSHTALPHDNRVVVASPKPGMVGKRPLRKVPWRVWGRLVSPAKLM